MTHNQVTSLAGEIVSSDNILATLANAWTFCRANFLDLKNVLSQDANLNDLNWRLRQVLYDTIKANCMDQFPFTLKNARPVREQLAAESDKEALVRCEALLRAASQYVAERLPGTGHGQYSTIKSGLDSRLGDLIIMRRSISAIAESSVRLPRSNEHVSDMLKAHHPRLDITPIVIDGRSIEPRLMRVGTLQLFRERLARGQIKVAVSCLGRNVVPRGFQFTAPPAHGPVPFLLESLGDDDALQIELLQNVLRQCHHEGISILVLPELRIPPTLLDVIQSFLKNQSWGDLKKGRGLLLVVAGSWHLDIDGEWRNRAHVFDHRGSILWTHDKMAEFNISPENVLRAPALRELLGIDEHGGVEQISVGRTLEFCDCALGRISVAVCVGFFHDPIRELLQASGANIFLVPAMSPDVRPLQERAKDLVRSQYAATFVANCGTVGQASGEFTAETASFYLLPIAGCQPETMKSPKADTQCVLEYGLMTISSA